MNNTVNNSAANNCSCLISSYHFQRPGLVCSCTESLVCGLLWLRPGHSGWVFGELVRATALLNAKQTMFLFCMMSVARVHENFACRWFYSTQSLSCMRMSPCCLLIKREGSPPICLSRLWPAVQREPPLNLKSLILLSIYHSAQFFQARFCDCSKWNGIVS